jgi:hypothetical protein
MITALAIALDYIGRGWNPVPVDHRSKKPSAGEGWQLRIIDANNAAQHFNGQQMNIGVMLGPSSHGLTDVDLDCDEARAVASYVLPRTDAIFGRASSRAAHRLYYTDLSVNADKAALVFNDPTTGGRVLELRIGGAKGAQTVFPGSTHKETGEPITWEETGEPASVDGDDLTRRIHDLAAYSLIARYWPAPGLKARHDAALIVGGFLARTGKSPQDIKIATEAIARAVNDPEWRNRRDAAEDAAEAFRASKHAFGLTGMRKQFGDAVADQIAEWLGYNGASERQDSSSEHSTGHNKDDGDGLIFLSSREFVANFVAPDPLIESILQRGFLYALTAHTGRGKSALALLFTALIALGRSLGYLDVEQGRCLYLAGENHTDIRYRWIAMAQQMDFDPDMIDVHFVEGRFSIAKKFGALKRLAERLGGLDFIVIDSSAAFFEGDDENNNAQASRHASNLRELTTLPGNPCVLALCHPPKNAGDDNLQPRGGGAYVAEIDGNLTATKDDVTITLYWQTKLRGADFTPINFLLRTVTHERLLSKTGKLMPTVVASLLTDAAKEEMTKTRRNDEDRVLQALDDNPDASFADLAAKLNWLTLKGGPNKSKVQRAVERLHRNKLLSKDRDRYELTAKGKKALKKG